MSLGRLCSRQFQFVHGNFYFTHGNFNFTYGNFNFTYGNFNFTYGNSNLLMAISQFYSRQFQFTDGNFAILLKAISILLTAISIYWRQFRNFTQGTFKFSTAMLTAFFASLTTVSATAADSGLAPKSKRKIKSRYLKSIFKEKSENHKSKVDLRTSLN